MSRALSITSKTEDKLSWSGPDSFIELTAKRLLRLSGPFTVALNGNFGDGKLIKQTISREQMIKRVANGYDASHSSLNEDKKTNVFDNGIDWMMQIKYMGIPLPQFILLHIAHEILENKNLILNK